jgi:uncharacterized protein (TIGR02118 family)
METAAPPIEKASYHARRSGGEQSERLIPARIGCNAEPGLLQARQGQQQEIGRHRMAKLLVLYKKPKSAEAFDKHYASVHIPLAKKIPGLKKYDISTGTVGTPAGPSGIHLAATLYFDSLDALKAGLASPQGQAAAGDLANFADGGAELYMFDAKEV